MTWDSGRAPARLRSQTSWLINQVALPATRVVTGGRAAPAPRASQSALRPALDGAAPSSRAELGGQSGIDRSEVGAAINELAAQGVTERAPAPADHRRNVVTM